MKSINKTAILLRVIEKKKLCTLNDLTSNFELKEHFSNTTSTNSNRRIIDTATLIAKKGYLSVGLLDNEKIYKITLKGKNHLRKCELLEVQLSQNFHDRWYLVCINLSQSHKTTRNQILLILKRYKFVQYSSGVWIIPYNPTELITLLKSYYNLKSELKLIVAQHIDYEPKFKQHFLKLDLRKTTQNPNYSRLR